MTEPEKKVRRMNAYYYAFDETGVDVVDDILSAVATAGKAYHHTDEWGPEGYVGKIQEAAAVAAREFVRLAAPVVQPETPPGTCWQPIETAPKDTPRPLVLLYRPNMAPDDRVAIRRPNDWCGPKCCPHAEPTHWQPLPAPPASHAAGPAGRQET